MKRIRELEELLLRVETAVAVALVLLMLAFASYNVFYRNVLVPVQRRFAESGPPIAAVTPPPGEPAKAPKAPKADGPAPSGDEKSAGEGFAGDFGDEPEPEPEPEPEAKAAAPQDEPSADGFAGDFGDEPEPKAAGQGEGFAGDFGDEPTEEEAGGSPKPEATPEDEDLSFDSEGETPEDQFENLPMIQGADDAVDADDTPKGGPPPPGSFAAWAVAFIDDIKLDWIDVFLRQLVIIASFFGAMVATQRRKHINIDALSRVLRPSIRRWVAAGINVVSIGVCFVLASAGWDLVKISQRYPKELLPWAEEWTFQLMFPVGFGLLALHFAIRLLEGITGTEPDEPTPAHTQAIVQPDPDADADPRPEPEPEAEAEPEPEHEPEPEAEPEPEDEKGGPA